MRRAPARASGKLVHGGLRYLEYYEFRLVREALIEREVLLRSAPHIIWPMRFVLPHSPEQRPAWMVRTGLFLYDHLGGRKMLPSSRKLDLRTAPEGRALKTDYSTAFEYSDCWVDDARLVVLNALDAKQRGAIVLTRTAATSARREGDGLWHVTMKAEDGATHTVKARALVNSAGPWVEDVVGRVAGRNSSYRVRLVKGSHIVVPKFWDGPQAYLFQNDDKRVIFVNPYEGNLCLIGTTDIPFKGRPEDASIDQAEIDYLLRVVNRYAAKPLAQSDIVSSYSGVRPLYDNDADANASAVTRDYVFEVDDPPGQPPLLSVFGGKITTFRKLAEHALDKLTKTFPGMGKAWTASAALPGGDLPNADFSAFLAALRREYAWAARRPRRTLRPSLRHPRTAASRRRQKHGRAWSAPRQPALRPRGGLPARNGMGQDADRHSHAPNQARAPHERRRKTRIRTVDGGGLTGSIPRSGDRAARLRRCP